MQFTVLCILLGYKSSHQKTTGLICACVCMSLGFVVDLDLPDLRILTLNKCADVRKRKTKVKLFYSYSLRKRVEHMEHWLYYFRRVQPLTDARSNKTNYLDF